MPRKNTRKQPTKKRVYLKLNAPEAQELKFAGIFNNWETETRKLKRGNSGDWRTFLALEPGEYEYRFLVDGTWMNQSDSDLVPNAFGTGNCVSVVS